MAIKLDMGSLFAEGLLGGIAGYAGEIGAEHKQARANEQAQAIEKMKTDSASRIEWAKQMIAHPEHYTAPGVDANGKRTDNTYISKFTPAADGTLTGTWEDTLVGSAPAKDDAAIAAGHDAAMAARSDAAAAAMAARSDASNAASAARSDASASRSAAAAAAAVAAAQVRDDAKAGRELTGLDAKATIKANADTNVAMRDFYAHPELQDDKLRQYGIDGSDSANGRDPAAESKFKRFTQEANYQSAGLPPPRRATQPTAASAAPTAPLTEQNAPMPPNPESGSGWSAKPFAEGQVYTDAQGRKAKYQGGQWVPAQ